MVSLWVPIPLLTAMVAQSSCSGALGQDSGMGRGGTALGLGLGLILVPLAVEESSDLVRHFLIESSTKGVHLKGASEELYFGKDGAAATATLAAPGAAPKAPASTSQDQVNVLHTWNPAAPGLACNSLTLRPC